MYVDLNPVRAAIAKSPANSPHTSAYDRIEANKGHSIPSAAYDLKPVPTAEAGKALQETPVDEMRKQRIAKRKNPTGRRIRRDGWLSPLKLNPSILSDEPQVHLKGLRSSDRGFLNLGWIAYKRLLDWTAAQTSSEISSDIPSSIAKTLCELGIDASMWRDLVWNWQKYFGKTVCVGRPESIRAHAEKSNRHHYRGQANVKACFS